MYVLNWSVLAANEETIKTDWPTIRRGQKDTHSLLLRLFSFSFFTGCMFAKNKEYGEEAKHLEKIIVKECIKKCDKLPKYIPLIKPWLEDGSHKSLSYVKIMQNGVAPHCLPAH